MIAGIVAALLAAAATVIGTLILVAYYGGQREQQIYAKIAQLQREDDAIWKDVEGIASKLRKDESRNERRWKHAIATQIEASGKLEEAKKQARLLREDAWRD